jgi:H/ACA ribonucleoprotein complex subunit 3
LVWILRKCVSCGEYTMNTESCPKCGGTVKMPHPAKFSMDDPYRRYRLRMRRLAKKE